jgi:hypothetical protein
MFLKTFRKARHLHTSAPVIAESALQRGGRDRVGSARWHWARGRDGARLEVEPAALRDLFALDERTRRKLQQLLFDVFDLAVVQPAAASGGPLQLWVSDRQVRYSVDVREKLVVVESVDGA